MNARAIRVGVGPCGNKRENGRRMQSFGQLIFAGFPIVLIVCIPDLECKALPKEYLLSSPQNFETTIAISSRHPVPANSYGVIFELLLLTQLAKGLVWAMQESANPKARNRLSFTAFSYTVPPPRLNKIYYTFVRPFFRSFNSLNPTLTSPRGKFPNSSASSSIRSSRS